MSAVGQVELDATAMMPIDNVGDDRVNWRRCLVGWLVGLDEVIEQPRAVPAPCFFELLTLPTTALDTFGALGAFERAFATRLVVGALHEHDFRALAGSTIHCRYLVDPQAREHACFARRFVG